METTYEIVKIRQVREEVNVPKKKITGPSDAAEIATHFIGDDDREIFLVMCLNTQNEVVAVHRCHVGSLNSSVVHPRDVFKGAILNNSFSIVVAHQHPSGMILPSDADKDVSKRLYDAGKLIGIEVLDSLIVNDAGRFYSLREKGYLR
ncbi:JAB domain-containing protein [Bacillus paranthracis]|uniref:JAB domain-containing protein n=1 Tax=Bacillus cereus group TaxID=86661 RepID=UPI000200F1E2|nr:MULTISPECIES: JAB domain-containing protein [Bacillus cereus group]ADY24833.1 putative DNA repair protein RadC [Bacillus thuringiensis serovar finitimus YBT-020]MEB9697990.1 JAB domain-containing protein [Bacillus cereus]MRC74019.1 DNA repair protein RadC [Bacillus thuringiensis]OTX71554.1 DNA repair protein RadC [Bacillus thuringiensis serovar finitimus]MEB9751968.1 JAB domain-containing protein [Bacillus cereus]